MKASIKKPALEISSEAQEEFDQAKKAALEAYGNFVEAKDHLKAAALNAGVEFKETANEQFHETVDKLSERKRQAMDDASDYIRENPVSSAGLAFLGGVIFGRFLSK
jgi:ElaB/YqjD/DUF883 family membrane-anchored ribosome-binding protein